MDNQALQQIKDIVDKNNQVAIIMGIHPSIDEMAAGLSLYLTLQTAGKKVSVASITQPLVEHSSLVAIDKVTTQLQGNGHGDLTVSFPYKEEGEIEKVSYTIDKGFLNIIVKAGEQGLSFTQDDVHFATGGGAISGLVCTVGVPHLADIASVLDPESIKAMTVINIDNKEENENYGNVVLVSPRFSSVSEQVADLLLSLGYDFDIDAAQNLLMGISSATQNFQAQNTSYLAFEIAAILLRKGAKRIEKRSQQQHEQTPIRQSQPAQVQKQYEQHQQKPVTEKTDDSWLEQLQRSVEDQQQRQQGIAASPSQPRQAQQQNRPHQQRPIPSQPEEDANPPADWLTPKVYKGSTTI